RRDRQPHGDERVLRARLERRGDGRGLPPRPEAPPRVRGVSRRRVWLQGPLHGRSRRRWWQGRRAHPRDPAHRGREGDAREEREERSGGGRRREAELSLQVGKKVFLALTAVAWVDNKMSRDEAEGILHAAKACGLGEEDLAAVARATESQSDLYVLSGL